MRYSTGVKILIISVLAIIGCTGDSETVNISTEIIPQPVTIETENMASSINKLNFCGSSVDFDSFEAWVSSWAYPILCNENADQTISLSKDTSLVFDYELVIGDADIIINYSGTDGLRNALSTLNQLIELNDGILPILKITDKQKFKYRGMHLDVSRHMFTVAEVKKYIDYLAFYKFNYFHWHLTDDQGWRIEIKKYPLLQERAAYRDETLVGHYNDRPETYDAKRYGGYYTQDELREVVAYAQERGIEVIPEIDVPGHTSAVLSAYPEFGCQKKEYETAKKWGVFYDVLCPYEKTFQFLDDVFEEIKDIFPSNYVHIGGDECPKDSWNKSAFCKNLMKELNLKDGNELQSHFIKRVSDILEAKGKHIIGWDEILEGGLAEGATVMSWRGEAGGIEAAREGHEVIMTPTTYCYFDYYQSEDQNEPLAIGGYLPIEKVYSWEVIPEDLNEDEQKYILGGQANVWTEYIPEFSKVEYMALARMITLSEVLWSSHEKNYEEFVPSLFEHIRYWQKQNVNIANHLLDITYDASVIPDYGVATKIYSPMKDAEIRYRSPSDSIFRDYSGDYLALTEKGIYTFRASYDELVGREFNFKFNPHLANNSSIEYKYEPAEKYNGSGPQTIINGIQGSDKKFGGSEWLGFDGKNLDVSIGFETDTKLNSLNLRFYDGPGQWIYPPSKIEIYSIGNNEEESLVLESDDLKTEGNIVEISFEHEMIVSGLRIVAHNYGEIPEGQPGAGYKPWLFVDEIIVE